MSTRGIGPSRNPGEAVDNALLRAPDPTLAALHDVVVVHLSEEPPVAHLLDDDDPYCGLRCDAPDAGDNSSMLTRHARWIAIPCRECFPGALGHPATCVPDGGCPGKPHPHLAWQVTS